MVYEELHDYVYNVYLVFGKSSILTKRNYKTSRVKEWLELFMNGIIQSSKHRNSPVKYCFVTLMIVSRLQCIPYLKKYQILAYCFGIVNLSYHSIQYHFYNSFIRCTVGLLIKYPEKKLSDWWHVWKLFSWCTSVLINTEIILLWICIVSFQHNSNIII